MQQPNEKPVAGDGANSNCGVSMRFNFTVGAVAVLLAAVIGYVAWRYLG